MRRSAIGILLLPLAAAVLWAASPRAAEPDQPVPPAPSVPGTPAVAAPAVPRLAIEKDVLDLGDVTRGAKAEATFILRNTGAEPVKILSAKPG